MKNLRSQSPVSNLLVLQLLTDRTTIDILNAVAAKVTSSNDIKELLGLTPKQYYVRRSRLMEAGIIKRTRAKFTLTSFGQLIYQELVKITTAMRHSRELILIDEQKHLVDKLILDDKIKKLFA